MNVKSKIYWTIIVAGWLMSTIGCEIDNTSSSGGNTARTSDEGINQAANDGTPVDYGPGPAPVPISSVPLAGEFSPDPSLIRYEFIFVDGTVLKFKENHTADFWGDYPAAGWGEITNPDGSKRGVDVNTIVRKGGLSKAKTPVTTLSHGKRMFWMADSEGRLNVKRVDIFEDGWNPLVEGALLATKDKLGITAPIASCKVVIERRK